MANAWIITTDNQVDPLVKLGRTLGGTVTAVTLGSAAVGGVDAIVEIPVADGVPAEAYAPAVAAAVTAAPGDVVLVANRSVERAVAGAVVAAHNAALVRGVVSLAPGKAEVSRFGGISVEELAFDGVLVAIVDAGASAEGEAPAAQAGSAEVHAASVVSVDKQDVTEVNLAAAKRIVSVGRGFKAQEDLKLAEELCEAAGAELACSRPLAEGTNWLSRERYVGVSGASVSPDLYLAVGISGQVQHTVGMSDSKIVVAINSDDKAPIFDVADYGIVGDLYQIVPALTAALK